MNECIVHAPLINVMCLLTEVDIIKEIFPDIAEIITLKSLTKSRGLY